LLGGIFKNLQGLRFLRQDPGQQGIENTECIELIEGRIDFQLGRGQPCSVVLGEGMFGGVLLTQQITRQTAIKAYTQVNQVLAGDLRLTNPQR